MDNSEYLLHSYSTCAILWFGAPMAWIHLATTLEPIRFTSDKTQDFRANWNSVNSIPLNLRVKAITSHITNYHP